jgi:hypothetical protein
MPIVIRAKEPTPISKKEAFKKHKKNKGYYHKADPNHPMNSERTGPSTLKEDPVYKKSGGKVLNCRS